MSYLKAKSDFNLDAAKVLIDEHSYFAPSVHCSYYGCFQFIKSKLNKIGITYDKMNQDIAGNPSLTSNKYPLELIVKEVEKKSDRYYSRDLKTKIKSLKTYRVISDYHNEGVDYDRGNAALKLSKEIIALIEQKL